MVVPERLGRAPAAADGRVVVVYGRSGLEMAEGCGFGPWVGELALACAWEMLLLLELLRLDF